MRAGTVTVDDIDSLLGRASLTVGTNFTPRGVAWQPLLHSQRVQRVRRGCARAGRGMPTLATRCIDGLLLTTSTSRVGTYGQFAPRHSRGDHQYRAGSAMPASTTRSARISMAGASTPACAISSLPSSARQHQRMAPATAWHTYNWTGAYLGGFVGTAWGDQDWFTSVINTKDEPRFQGYLLGGQAGYNVQAGRVVLRHRSRLRLVECQGREVLHGRGEPVLLHLRGRGQQPGIADRAHRPHLGACPVLRQGRSWPPGKPLSRRRRNPGTAGAPVQHGGQRREPVAVWLDHRCRHGVRPDGSVVGQGRVHVLRSRPGPLSHRQRADGRGRHARQVRSASA